MKRDSKFGRELIESMQEALAILRGEKEPARVHLPPGSRAGERLLQSVREARAYVRGETQDGFVAHPAASDRATKKKKRRRSPKV